MRPQRWLWTVIPASAFTVTPKEKKKNPVPTAQLKAIVDIITPFLTSLFNRSLLSGSIPEAFKAAYTTLILKKSDMDPADIRSYRPISNLSVSCV